MYRLLALSAGAAFLAGTSAPAQAADTLMKLLPKPLDGWRAPFKPIWRKNSSGGGRAFLLYRQRKGNGKVEVIYNWKSPYGPRWKRRLANPEEAKRFRYKIVTVRDHKFLYSAQPNFHVMNTVVSDNLAVTVQGRSKAHVDRYLAKVPIANLAKITKVAPRAGTGHASGFTTPPQSKQLMSLLPAAPSGWERHLPPAWSNRRRGSGYAWAGYKKATAAYVNIRYRWKFNLKYHRRLIADPAYAKKYRWQTRKIAGHTVLMRPESSTNKNRWEMYVIVSDLVEVFLDVRTPDPKVAETFVKALPIDKLAGVR